MGQKISLPDYAKRLGVSREAVLQRINRNTLPAVKIKNRWVIDIEEADQYQRTSNNFLGASGEKDFTRPEGIPDSPLIKAKTERELALAEIKKMEAAKMRGDLVEIRLIKKQIFAEGRRVRDAFLNLPSRISAEIACETEPIDVEQMLDREIRAILEDLSVPMTNEEDEEDEDENSPIENLI
jgi:hypothetical protein